MTPPLHLTWHQIHHTGRIVAKLGEIEVGEVLPPLGKHPYAWRFWLEKFTTPRYDSANSELAAKSALTARVADWLRDAGLQQVPY
jgi:hypothetical protein